MKKPLCLLLLPALLSPFSVSAGEADAPSLTVPILFEKEIPADIQLVEEAADALVFEKTGIRLQLVPLLFNASSSSTDQRRISELSYLEKQGICFDVLPDTLQDSSFIPLDSLLETYGQDIVKLADKEQLALLASDGTLDRLPSVSDYVSSFGITMRKDLAEKYDLDLSRIKRLGDLDAVFAQVHKSEPDLYMVCGYRTGRGFVNRLTSALIDVAPVCIRSKTAPDMLINYYATEEYRDMVSAFYRWNQNGYVPPNLSFQNLTASDLVEAGALFSYFSAYKPGIAYEESVSCGQEMISIQLMEPMVTEFSLSSTVHWGISDTCAQPENAMKFLNLLYTDSELTNLLIYGIEDLHYTVQPDGTIDYPDGLDAKTVSYQNTQPWLLPNQFLSYIWSETNPLLWEETRQFNESAAVKDTLYFDFDSSAVSGQLAAIDQILDTYTYGLESGQLDPDYYLPRMLAEMEEAGVEQVLKETQKQFDAWLEGDEHS